MKRPKNILSKKGYNRADIIKSYESMTKYVDFLEGRLNENINDFLNDIEYEEGDSADMDSFVSNFRREREDYEEMKEEMKYVIEEIGYDVAQKMGFTEFSAKYSSDFTNSGVLRKWGKEVFDQILSNPNQLSLFEKVILFKDFKNK